MHIQKQGLLSAIIGFEMVNCIISSFYYYKHYLCKHLVSMVTFSEAPCNCGRTQYDVGCHYEAALAGAPLWGGGTEWCILAVKL